MHSEPSSLGGLLAQWDTMRSALAHKLLLQLGLPDRSMWSGGEHLWVSGGFLGLIQSLMASVAASKELLKMFYCVHLIAVSVEVLHQLGLVSNL